MTHGEDERARAEQKHPKPAILGIPSGYIIFLMFCAVIFSFGAVLFKVLVAEREAAAREIKSVSRVFETHKHNLLREMERYAASNAAYENVETHPSIDWIESRFGVDMALDFKHAYTAVLDKNGDVTFAIDFHGTTYPDVYTRQINQQLETTLSAIRDKYRQALVRPGGQVRFTGQLSDISGVDIVEIDGRPNIAAAFAIVPDPGGIDMRFASPNILLTIFEIDAVHLSDLLASLSLDNLKFVTEVPEDMISVPLANNAGTVLGYLAWYPMSRASSIIVSSIPILLISLGIILTIALLTMRQNAHARRSLARREQEARHTANHDSMTGFASRSYFHSLATKWLMVRGALRNRASVIYLDLDNLKQVNDIHGHAAGDQLIIEQARRIQQVLGSNGLIGRIGGDEFVILTERWGAARPQQSEIEELFRVLSLPVAFEDRQIETSCSAGIARFPEHGRKLPELIRAADIALHRCKQEQKNSFRYYDDRMDEQLREQRELRIDLVSAIRENELELFYQPIVTAKTGDTVFYEALIRWRHPKRGLISPAVFLPVARNADMMSEIGAWVLERALGDARGWDTAGVSINVCTSQIRKHGLAEQVADLLVENEFSADRLILEITEDLLMEESAETLQTIQALRDLGIGLAIDDFGTGYSSLSYLHKFRFDKMKIDRSFVSRIGQEDEADTLIRSMLGLARAMGMQTVGEGVETTAQKQFLVDAGCEYLQGYLFGKPAPLSELDLPDVRKSASA
ncbi:bifunctional diguanylate cyclase/phosphodiesterase [uncultured Roseibium sp.]|uniref:bifunctional diguanylate cyclase/phosphodiesterase n=1 Tax=uncultured Roseibium sp. TaxID=1936171 RepID=UPI002601C419|nr:bifunctional diguanylate cyclase/phosphodiesterase [uncultured Roseibium sp.]